MQAEAGNKLKADAPAELVPRRLLAALQGRRRKLAERALARRDLEVRITPRRRLRRHPRLRALVVAAVEDEARVVAVGLRGQRICIRRLNSDVVRLRPLDPESAEVPGV